MYIHNVVGWSSQYACMEYTRSHAKSGELAKRHLLDVVFVSCSSFSFHFCFVWVPGIPCELFNPVSDISAKAMMRCCCCNMLCISLWETWYIVLFYFSFSTSHGQELGGFFNGAHLVIVGILWFGTSSACDQSSDLRKFRASLIGLTFPKPRSCLQTLFKNNEFVPKSDPLSEIRSSHQFFAGIPNNALKDNSLGYSKTAWFRSASTSTGISSF